MIVIMPVCNPVELARNGMVVGRITLLLLILNAPWVRGGELDFGNGGSQVPPVETVEKEAPEQQPEPKDEEDEERKKPFEVYWDEGLHISGLWENVRMKIGGDIQNDTAGFANTDSAAALLDTEIEGGVEWRRVRGYIEGAAHKNIEFKFRYDFSVSNPPNLKDAFINFVNLPIPDLEVTVGRFRAPLGLDGYTGADDTVFLERSTMTSAFLPSRNTGLLAHGDSPRHRIRWSFGALQPESDQIDLQNTDNLGYSGRFATAFPTGADDRYLIHLGADFWRRNIKPSIELASRPESNIAPFFVDTGEIDANHLDLAIAEAAIQRGPLTVQGEFAATTVHPNEGDNLFFYAFYAQASYFITGETARYRTERGTFARPRPKREFRDGAGGRGAFEVGFRFSRIDLSDRDVTGGILNDWSVAFNWYPVYSARVMFNFILADLEGAEPVAVVQMRLQIGF